MASMPRHVKLLSGLSKVAGVVFFVSFGLLLIAIVGTTIGTRLWGLVVAYAVLAMFVSAAVFMSSLLLRDLAANEWRFSLRTLLITMTLVAAGLGTIAWALK
jgi:hypothetical protein